MPSAYDFDRMRRSPARLSRSDDSIAPEVAALAPASLNASPPGTNSAPVFWCPLCAQGRSFLLNMQQKLQNRPLLMSDPSGQHAPRIAALSHG